MIQSQQIADFIELFNQLLMAHDQPRLSEGQTRVLSRILHEMMLSPRRAAQVALRTIQRADKQTNVPPLGGKQIEPGVTDDPCPKCGHYPTRRRLCDAIGCEDGWIDMYEHDDPLWYDPGDLESCHECNGFGNLWWCPECGFDMHLREGETMLDYFIRKCDLIWFNTPKRPLPPLYTRPRNTNAKPTCETPTGPLTVDDLWTLVKLTDEQVSVWRAA